ncbi:MAG: hypothetical protein N3D85_03715 [Candidatus Bathyarchaeota archaeon]|nr:hypothetical protein [Candidatus Bathyarchaeota archaeon]
MRVDNQGVSPAISSVILTAAVVVMVLVAMVYTNRFLDSRMAENEFNTNKQFMLTTGLQLDDIAWTMGRTQTIRYSSRFAQLNFEPTVLQYSFEVLRNTTWQQVFTGETGVILFNMPISAYTIGNNYFERIFPSTNGSFLQHGSSAPVSHVYVIEKLPMPTGNFTRVVVVPSLRVLQSKIGNQNYFKFYLPMLEGGTNLWLSQSVTLTGKNVTQYVLSSVSQARFKIGFPKASEGFDSSFFPFQNTLQAGYYSSTLELPPNSVVEFYVGEVRVSMGLHI